MKKEIENYLANGDIWFFQQEVHFNSVKKIQCITIDFCFNLKLLNVWNFISVVDFGITLPDYTYYITTCVNYALAWALPDKPTYPQEELMEHYEMGRLPLLLRNDKNITDTGSEGEIQVSTSYNQINVSKTTPSSTKTTTTT